jgi:hypothetical protein
MTSKVEFRGNMPQNEAFEKSDYVAGDQIWRKFSEKY